MCGSDVVRIANQKSINIVGTEVVRRAAYNVLLGNIRASVLTAADDLFEGPSKSLFPVHRCRAVAGLGSPGPVRLRASAQKMLAAVATAVSLAILTVAVELTVEGKRKTVMVGVIKNVVTESAAVEDEQAEVDNDTDMKDA